ncbi:hypothetical protein H8744_14660 [Oscillospiraceae bacterium N12]|jgi:hypothetical protein|uniref:Uncharacterized protein n=1 Tax=Jilunia laotingensis TaxID=2763675 RepID=A0A926F5P2_9BACT|nr:hypothetical protein [Jilunia laotingensis]MBC8594455.1 hypothetical protein [Jilunia laotingensis]
MKKLICVFFWCFLYCFYGFSQTSQQATSLFVNDTRDVNELPSSFKREIRANLKKTSVVGLENYGTFSTNLSIAPWNDGSAGLNHQLNFNDKGIFYRNGNVSTNLWNNWNRVMLADSEGNVELIGSAKSQNDESYVSLILSNKGVNGGPHRWKISTASYAGGYGVKSNGYEIWEYPALVNSNDDCCKRRFVIQTCRDQASYSAVIIGPKGGLNIGYPYYYTATDLNALSVNGNVAIGTVNTEGYKLAVNGIIGAAEIIVKPDWADFVFKKEYKLPTLNEVEQHINEKGTLPGVPSEEEVKVNGIKVGEVNALLLQKIEELTLYVIKQQREIDELKQKIKD